MIKSDPARSFRRLARNATAVTIGVTLLLVMTLGIRTVILLRANQRVADAAAGSALAPDLEAGFRAHERLTWLHARTNDPRVLDQRRQTTDRLDAQLSRAEQASRDPRERQVVSELHAEINGYVASRDRLDQEARSAAFDSVVRKLDEFRRLNEAQLRDAQRLTMWLSELAMVVGIISILVVVWTGIYFHRRLREFMLDPLVSFSDTIGRLAAGDSTARVREDLPTELNTVATAFNRMASALEWQRQNELSYLAAVAHDLRNPLAALKTGVAIVEKKTGTPNGMTGTFTAINRQIDRLSRMIGDLLDMVRIEAGKLELRKEPVDLRHIVREQAEFYRPTSDKHELEIALPNEPAICECDAMRVEQLLGNLIINAIKYSPRGGQVRVELELTADDVVISVEDEGVGMPKDALEKIFAPFWRRRMEGRVEGAGLGLSVVRRIVEAHGGKVEVESELHMGSVFRVRLPRAKNVGVGQSASSALDA